MSKLATLTLFVLFAVGSSGARTSAFAHQQSTHRYEDTYYLPPAELLVIGSLGYRESAASLLWMKALVYYSDELLNRGQGAYLVAYASAIATLDPQFSRIYSWAASVSLYKYEAASVRDVRDSIKLLNRARTLFPDNGEFAWQLGSTYLYALAPLQPLGKERIRTLAKGRELLQIAALLGGGPPWASLNAASHLIELGRSEQALRHLMEVYSTIEDDYAKKQLEIRLRTLNNESFVLALRASVTDFQRSHSSHFPFVDDGIFYLLESPENVAREDRIEGFSAFGLRTLSKRTGP